MGFAARLAGFVMMSFGCGVALAEASLEGGCLRGEETEEVVLGASVGRRTRGEADMAAVVQRLSLRIGTKEGLEARAQEAGERLIVGVSALHANVCADWTTAGAWTGLLWVLAII